MSKSTPNLRLSYFALNYKLFRFQSLHDYCTAVFLLILLANYSIALAVLIYLLPVAEHFWAKWRSSPLPDSVVKQIYETLSLAPKGINFRWKNTERCQGYGLAVPLFNGNKMVLLTHSTYEDLTSKVQANYDQAIATVAHEIGHLPEYDRTVYRWLQGAHLSLIAYTGYYAIKWVNLLLADSLTSESTMLNGLIAIFFTLYWLISWKGLRSSILHRREHIADLIAFEFIRHKFVDFLRKLRRIEKRSESSKQKYKQRNQSTHPSTVRRLKAFEGPYHIAYFSMPYLSKNWTLTILFSISAGYVDNPLDIEWYRVFIACFALSQPFFLLANLPIQHWYLKKAIREYTIGILLTLQLFWILNLLGNVYFGVYYLNPHHLLYLAGITLVMWQLSTAWSLAMQKLSEFEIPKS